MYAGGKYDNGGDNYEFSLGLNGLGLCATQYASEYMEAEIHTDGYKYTLHFEKGENIGGLKKEKYDKRIQAHELSGSLIWMFLPILIFLLSIFRKLLKDRLS